MITNPIPNFPFKAWFVGPSGKPKELAFVRQSSWSRSYLVTASGQMFNCQNLFRKESDAWTAGEKRLSDRQARITKAQTNLDKHVTAFVKERTK